jgi:hypothetical protein
MMRRLSSTGLVVLLLVMTGSPVSAAQPPEQPVQQDEFVPIDQLPQRDQLPAAPLLITAYSFVLVALFFYLFSVARRLRGVTADIERLAADLKRSGRA